MSTRTLRSRMPGTGLPVSSQKRRSCASAMAWNVPAVTDRCTPSRARRVLSSPAALRVNVTASTCAGSIAPSWACHAMRWVRTRVLPEPAPARIASGLAVLVTASRCDSSRRASSSLPCRSACQSPRAPYRRGTTATCHDGPRERGRERGPERGRERGRPRVVIAASQLRAPRGTSFGHSPFPRITPVPACAAPKDNAGCSSVTLSPGLPRGVGLDRGHRLPHVAGVVPLRSVTAPTPPLLSSRGCPLRSASGTRFVPCRSQHRTDARARIQEAKFRVARIDARGAARDAPRRARCRILTAHGVPQEPDPGRRDGRPRPPSALVVLLAQHPHRDPAVHHRRPRARQRRHRRHLGQGHLLDRRAACSSRGPRGWS